MNLEFIFKVIDKDEWQKAKQSGTYSGLTVTGVVLFAVLKFNQVPNLYGIIGIILIIIGVIMVNYLGRLN